MDGESLAAQHRERHSCYECWVDVLSLEEVMQNLVDPVEMPVDSAVSNNITLSVLTATNKSSYMRFHFV